MPDKPLRLDDPAARRKLKKRQAPYWLIVTPGLALGYRAGLRGGRWLIRMQNAKMSPPRRQEVLGNADDTVPADGKKILSYEQARTRALARYQGVPERHWTHPQGQQAPPLVRDAVMNYLAMLEAHAKSADRARQMADCHILERDIAKIPLQDLTTAMIEHWHRDLSQHRKMTRAGRAKSGNKWLVPDDSPETQEAIRARKATANRVLGIFKAALNYQHSQAKGSAGDPSTWQDVKRFRGVASPEITVLRIEDQLRLLDACAADLKVLIQGALLTGARFSELATLNVAQLHLEQHSFHLPPTKRKSNKPTDIPLSEEAVTLLSRLSQGKGPKDLIFTKEDGSPWKRNHQTSPFKQALAKAGLPDMRWHELRHSFAVRMLEANTPPHLVSRALGHANNRMLEKHYARFLSEWVADAFNKHAPWGGILQEDASKSM